MSKPLVCEDGEHCEPDCPFLKENPSVEVLQATCAKSGAELDWYDYWLADCINMTEP